MPDDDIRVRCPWGVDPPEYRRYHDEEWGRPVVDDTRLFEKLCLEGFQAGLSWLTILRKRDAFRRVFARFDVATVAAYGPTCGPQWRPSGRRSPALGRPDGPNENPGKSACAPIHMGLTL